jgi:dTDP-4-dehydrorhamnose 3,5-epimerase
MVNIDGVKLFPLKHIAMPGGNIFHAMKNSDAGYDGFGEAYFSTIEPSVIKAWKRHNRMTLNLIVPVGTIRFVIYDDRVDSPSFNRFYEVTLSQKNYFRLTIPPMVWMGFQCVGNVMAMLLNIANIPHMPSEVDRKEIEDIMFNWNLNK